ncbi:MAG: glycerate kinase, partial [Elioraea tepidiphila]
MAIAGATLTPGFELAAEAVGLDALLDRADRVVTGEGRLDRQSFEGKVVGRLAARCRARGLPLVALV